MPKTPLIIGVAGGSGSGKTTLALNLNEAISNSVILSHDYYYKDNSNISFEERVTINYDHPNAFDTDLMVEDLKKDIRRYWKPPERNTGTFRQMIIIETGIIYF